VRGVEDERDRGSARELLDGRGRARRSEDVRRKDRAGTFETSARIVEIELERARIAFCEAWPGAVPGHRVR
jgi:hypothetical protein